MSRPAPNMAWQRTRRPRFRSGRSLGSPLNARLLGRSWPFLVAAAAVLVCWTSRCASPSPTLTKSRSGLGAHEAHGPVPVDAKCENITKPKLIYGVTPIYSESARRFRVEGEVVAEGIIGLVGTVSDIRVLSSPSNVLTHLALEAFSQWRYVPAFCGDLGAPIRVYVIMTATFSLK
jgi:TonB family protein